MPLSNAAIPQLQHETSKPPVTIRIITPVSPFFELSPF
jgi:hypothetical protein